MARNRPVNDQSLPVDGNEASRARRKETERVIEEIDLNIGAKKSDIEYRLKNERNGGVEGRGWRRKTNERSKSSRRPRRVLERPQRDMERMR